MWPFTKPPAPAPVAAPAPAKPAGMKVSAMAAINALGQPQGGPVHPFILPVPPPGVRPAGPTLAMDDAGDLGSLLNWGASQQYHEGLTFLGYPILAEMAQRPEYRRAVETIAEEQVREWVRLRSTGDDDKADKIQEIEAEFERLKVRDVFRQALELDGYFGRGQIYLDTGATDDPAELRTPLVMVPAKMRKGSLLAIRAIDPTWTSPQNYNSADPLKPDYFIPRTWFVMGKEVHATRLLTIISRPLTDMLKPAYNFGGLSLTQLMLPYVQNWLRTRQSVSDLLHSFSVFVMNTNLEGLLAGGDGSPEAQRIALFTRWRDNRGLMVVDKETEELTNVSAPLGTLDALQAQSQEQMASVSGIPVVKLLGITPSGLNASSDGEIRVFYDHVLALQQANIRAPLSTILKAVQLNIFGAVDDEIDFEFQPLWQPDEQAMAAIRQSDAAVDQTYVDMGVVSPEEVRARVARSKDSAYAGLDVDDMPDPPDMGLGDPEATLAGPGGGIKKVKLAPQAAE